MCGLKETGNLHDVKYYLKMKGHVKIGVPYPNNINELKVLKAIPFGTKTIEVVKGGLIAEGIAIKELGDETSDILVCCATVTVSILE